MIMNSKRANFFSGKWKIILIVLAVLLLLILLIIFGSKKAVSPDVAYFPT